ncbi:MAG: alpha/beta hydrolase [Bacteroidales bacterium]|nr:alpha/beta hydrolase [Candidatus Sodaliphilus aphodohippi]
MRYLYLLIVLLATTSCGSYLSYTDTIEVNGQRLLYAAEGKGKPVILIHGNGGSHNDLETTQRQLAQAGYMVYALDSRGQGANKPLTEYHYKDMADDVLAFINAKGLKHPAIYGWSDGGIIALELESMHPGTCSLLAVSGANIYAERPDRPKVFTWSLVNEDKTKLTPLEKMMDEEPDMTREDLQKIKVPVLVCAGDKDLILPEHTRMIADYLPLGQLKIIPDATHGSYIVHNPLMGEILLDFLKKNKY